MHKTKRRVCFLDDAAKFFLKKNQIKIFGRFFSKKLSTCARLSKYKITAPYPQKHSLAQKTSRLNAALP
jgi:hypothetical protein